MILQYRKARETITAMRRERLAEDKERMLVASLIDCGVLVLKYRYSSSGKACIFDKADETDTRRKCCRVWGSSSSERK